MAQLLVVGEVERIRYLEVEEAYLHQKQAEFEYRLAVLAECWLAVLVVLWPTFPESPRHSVQIRKETVCHHPHCATILRW